MLSETRAKDCKCCECGEQAVCFWPITDPDIPHYPYCRACVEKAKSDLLLKMFNAKLLKVPDK